MTIHDNVIRYEDLTAAEQAGMEEFIRLWTSGQQHDASRANTIALDLEHMISTVNLDGSKATADELNEVRELRDAFHNLTGRKVLLHLLGDLE